MAKTYRIKIQRPLMTTADIPHALIYDKKRTFQIEVPWEDVANLFEEDDLKVYHLAQIRKGKLIIGQPCKPF